MNWIDLEARRLTLALIGEPGSKREEMAAASLRAVARRCAEIATDAKRQYDDEACTLTMRVGLDCVAANIRREFGLEDGAV